MLASTVVENISADRKYLNVRSHFEYNHQIAFLVETVSSTTVTLISFTWINVSEDKQNFQRIYTLSIDILFTVNSSIWLFS